MRTKFASLVFALFSCLIQNSFSQIWNGAVSTDWNTASNWTPATVPGAGNDVFINDPTAPNQPSLSGNISIRDLNMVDGTLNLSSFILTITRNGTVSGGTISNGTLNVLNYSTLQNTTFNGNINLIKSGGNDNFASGGNTYNGPTTIRNDDNNIWRHASINGDTFNSTVTFIKGSSGILDIAYNGTNIFNDEITINNLNATNALRIGFGGGISTLNSGGLITSSFALGSLDIRNFTQVTNTPNGNFSPANFTIENSTLLGNFSLTAANGITVLGNNQFCTGSGSACTFVKNGGGNSDWVGGNTFGTVFITNNDVNSRLRLAASGGGDTFNSTSTFTNTGAQFLEIARTGINTFANSITINNANATGEIAFGLNGGTSILTTGGLLTTDFNVGTLLQINNFIQLENAPNSNFGVTTFTSLNSSFQGDFGVTAATINFAQANTFARNGNFTATNINQTIAGSSFATSGGAVTFTKTGGANNQWYGGNTFGTLELINNADALLRLATTEGDTFINTSVFTNTGNNYIDIAFRGTNTFGQQITINNSNAAGSIRFGEVTASSTSTLVSGGVITSDFTVGNLLEFNNFTQIENAPNSDFGVTTFTSLNSSFQGDFGVTATTINFTQANTFARNGTFTAANINMTQAGNSFATASGSAIFTKTAGGSNQWYGGNTFGIFTLNNNSDALIRLATNEGDTFNSTSVFTNTGNNYIDIAFRGTNTFGQQITINNSNAAGSIRFGEVTASSTSTLVSGGVVTSNFSVGNLLEFNNFTQVENTPNSNFGVTTFTTLNSSFQGDFGVEATTITFTQANTFARSGNFTAANINQTIAGSSFATSGGAVTFTKTGGGNNQWYGGNNFGVANFVNNSGSLLRLANTDPDTFFGNVSFVRTSGGAIEPAFNGINSFKGNISTVGSNASIFFSEGNGTVLIDGNNSQFWAGDLSESPIAELVQINSTGTLTLDVPLRIDQSFTFSNGIVYTTNTNILTFIDNATAVGASDASYVDGPVTKVGNDNFEFPIGKSGFYAPSTVGGGGNLADSYTSEYFYIAPHAIPTDTVGKEPTIGLMNKSEHWNFTRNSGTASRSLVLRYDAGRTTPIIDHTELILIYWDGAVWRDFGGVVSGNASTGVVTRSSNTSSGLFSIASSFRILPIELLEFKATETKDKTIKISWITASEKNNAFFTLEKSLDGKIWETVAIIPSSGHSLEQVSYEFIDRDVRYGRQFYRLTQTDYDGRFETFQVIGISLVQEPNGSTNYVVYPNPSTGKFTLQGTKTNLSNTVLEIYDLNGRLVLKASEMKNKRQQFDISSLPKGIYILRLLTLEGVETKKLILH